VDYLSCREQGEQAFSHSNFSSIPDLLEAPSASSRRQSGAKETGDDGAFDLNNVITIEAVHPGDLGGVSIQVGAYEGLDIFSNMGIGKFAQILTGSGFLAPSQKPSNHPVMFAPNPRFAGPIQPSLLKGRAAAPDTKEKNWLFVQFIEIHAARSFRMVRLHQRTRDVGRQPPVRAAQPVENWCSTPQSRDRRPLVFWKCSRFTCKELSWVVSLCHEKLPASMKELRTFSLMEPAIYLQQVLLVGCRSVVMELLRGTFQQIGRCQIERFGELNKMDATQPRTGRLPLRDSTPRNADAPR